MDRAYSLITVKEMDDERRVIRGMATTPEVDRQGDIVDPFGVKVAGDIPLFLYHDSNQTVGRAKFGKPTTAGIPFEAHLPVVKEAGRLKDRVDEAWQMVKYRLITGVSIGFRAMEDGYERMKNGGLKFTATEVLELSLVPVPANASATISAIKSIDGQQRAALGHSPSSSKPQPGASGTKQQPASGGFSFSRSRKGIEMKTIKELQEARELAANRMKELLDVEQMNDDESAEFDTLETEVKALDGDIRKARFAAVNAAGAKGVDGSSSAAASRSRGPMIHIKSSDLDEKFKGQNYTRMVIAKALAHLHQSTPSAIAEARWGKSNPTLVRLVKANEVAAGGATTGEWGAELVTADNRYTGDFIEYLHGMTVYDKLPLREVPANVTIKGSDGAATGYWVGESKGIPLSAPSASTVSLTPLKVAALAVVSNELLRDSSPAAEAWVRDMLAQASGQRVDQTFLSTTAASAGVSPAGLLNGVTAGFSAGNTADNLRADIEALYESFITAKMSTGLYFVTTPTLAKAISLMRNSLGQKEFEGVTGNGGSIEGDPMVVGDNVGAGDFILLRPSDIWKIGDSGLSVSVSREATIEMSSAPVAAGLVPTGGTENPVNMFQAESTAIKVVRSINFQKRRTGAVAYIGDAQYGALGT
jgi:HK97 family phage major capsid protein/HK97 family phage prohead protease